MRGSYGRLAAAASARAGVPVSQQEHSSATSSDDGDSLTGLKPSKANKTGAAVVTTSPLFGAATVFNPYSFSQRSVEGRLESFSSSDSDVSPSPPIPPKGKKLLPDAVPALKLPAVAALQGQGAGGSGPVLSGYDSWSEDDADAEGDGGARGGDDDWSDTEAPLLSLPQTQSSHKPKPAGAAVCSTHAAADAVPSSSSSASACERVDAWAARHAVGGLLGLMLHMRRCFKSRITASLRVFDVTPMQRPRHTAARGRSAPHFAIDGSAGAAAECSRSL